jgi:hypothetical protein
LPASALSRFRHYRNLDSTESRLRQLLKEFRFSTMRAVFEPEEVLTPGPLAVALPYVW